MLAATLRRPGRELFGRSDPSILMVFAGARQSKERLISLIRLGQAPLQRERPQQSRQLSNPSPLTNPPSHFPKLSFEPGRFPEDCGELGFARRRRVEVSKTVQVSPSFRRDLLVGGTSIF